ncbi:MAG TPA: HAMP domain-containing sensor histidine kinase [Clostridia bacterium]|nr:HAMP domain-containing sensor histidine kinase [Clostridia bacterium]
MNNRIYGEKKEWGVAALFAVTATALVLSVLLSILAVTYANRSTQDSYARITAAVCRQYPNAERAVVREIQNSANSNPAEGYRILGRYGLKELKISNSGAASEMIGYLLPRELAFTGLFCAAFLFLEIRSRIHTRRGLNSLTEYLRRIHKGKDSLDLRDNGEGSFSILKNEIYKITVMLREQAETLKRDKTALADSIADISHQIKTPLTSLFVLEDLLTSDPPEDARREFLIRLRQQLERIQWLISSLLKLSRLDAGAVELKRDRVLFEDLMKKAAEPLEIPADIKNQRIQVSGSPSAGFTGDLGWSAEAVSNILKNCLEHTPEGGEIQVKFEENTLFSALTITDNGEGVAPEDLPHIFSRFYRGKNASENSVGIGLAIAKAVIQAQGGEITAGSETGRGTTFEIKIYRGVI